MHDERWLFDPEPKTLGDYWWYNEDLSERKRYLFMAAVGRRVAHLMTEPACVRAAGACEDYAEGAIGIDHFVDLMDKAGGARIRSQTSVTATRVAHSFVVCLTDDGKLNECVDCGEMAFGYAAATAAGELPPDTNLRHWEAIDQSAAYRSGHDAADREFTVYCLDIFGPNPFALPGFDPAWRTSTVVALARQMYDARDFGAMPILADALQDAGCDSDDILNHCRDPKQVHVRGCWVVDLVLGKS